MGPVGIGSGNTAPDFPLDVQGSSRFNGYMHFGGSGGGHDVAQFSWASGTFKMHSTSGRSLQLGADGSDGHLAISTSGNTTISGDLTVSGYPQFDQGSIFIQERASAQADSAAYGQIWVKNASPNELWFTDDAGTDTQLGVGGGGGSVDLSAVAQNILPDADNTRDLGSSAKRWANAYVADAHFNNTGTGGNEVDGTEGSWTIQEGEEDLFLLNRKNGKKYKFKLEVVK